MYHRNTFQCQYALFSKEFFFSWCFETCHYFSYFRYFFNIIQWTCACIVSKILCSVSTYVFLTSLLSCLCLSSDFSLSMLLSVPLPMVLFFTPSQSSFPTMAELNYCMLSSPIKIFHPFSSAHARARMSPVPALAHTPAIVSMSIALLVASSIPSTPDGHQTGSILQSGSTCPLFSSRETSLKHLFPEFKQEVDRATAREGSNRWVHVVADLLPPTA